MRFDRRSLFLAAAVSAASGGPAFAAEAKSKAFATLAKGAAPNARNVRGKILYIGEDDKERGREWFSFSFRKDGQRTLRAYCEIDDARVERDVVYTMDEKFRPLDCFVRLTVGGKFLGTGWIRITPTEAECDVLNVTMGRIHQVVPLTTPAVSLGAHPLACDAMALPAFDHSKPEKVQSRSGGLMTSPLLDGASGPMIGMSQDGSKTEYVGPERIVTPAGTFDAHHYRFPTIEGQAPHPSGNPRSEDIWVTHPDYIFVRAEVRGYLRNKTGFGRYELVEYEA